MSELFLFDPSRAPWGDYGHVLAHGISWHSPRREDGALALERVGPFVPPITFPGGSDVVVNTSLRDQIVSCGLGPMSFRPVWKKRVVRIDWRSWDLSAPEPKVYPSGSEPENYVLRRKHVPELADAIGELWEAVIPVKPGLRLKDGVIDPARYDGEDLVKGRELGPVYASSRFKFLIESVAAEWVSFTPMEVGKRDEA